MRQVCVNFATFDVPESRHSIRQLEDDRFTCKVGGIGEGWEMEDGRWRVGDGMGGWRGWGARMMRHLPPTFFLAVFLDLDVLDLEVLDLEVLDLVDLAPFLPMADPAADFGLRSGALEGGKERACGE